MPDVADYLVQRMHTAGVRTLFGLPGGGGNLDLIEAAGRADLPFVLTATETGSALAALAQAEITGAPGACLTALGPGAASVVNGVACAMLDRAPMLVVTDSHPADGSAFEHQRLDHQAILGPVTKWSGSLAPGSALQTVDEAFARLAELPSGPVHLDWPGAEDTRGRVLPAPFDRLRAPRAGRGAPARPVPPVLNTSAGVDWSRVRKPLLIVGLGARAAADARAIRMLCEAHGIPALVTYKAKGVVPDNHAWFGGIFTHGAIERALIELSDLLIGVGFDPVEILPRPWTYSQPIISLAGWRMADEHVPFQAQAVGSVASLVSDLGERLTRTDWDAGEVRARVEAALRAVDEAARHGRSLFRATGLTAQHVVRAAARQFAGRGRVTVDAGAHMLAATMLWPVAEPNELLISNGLSTMGFALPAAIGAAVLERGDFVPAAPPSRAHSRGPLSPAPFTRVRVASLAHDAVLPVIALTGDGGLLICLGELATAARERLRIVIIVFNDASLSLIEIKQQARKLAPNGVGLGSIDWLRIAEGFGLAAWTASNESELDHALETAGTFDGPCLIEARMDCSNYAATLRAIRG